MPAGARETPDATIAYRQPADEVIAALATDARRGLSDEQARARLEHYGRNELAAEKPVPARRRFLAQFQEVLVILLLVATAVSAGLCVLERDTPLPYEAIVPARATRAIFRAADDARDESGRAAHRRRAHAIPRRHRRTARYEAGLSAARHRMRRAQAARHQVVRMLCGADADVARKILELVRGIGVSAAFDSAGAESTLALALGG